VLIRGVFFTAHIHIHLIYCEASLLNHQAIDILWVSPSVLIQGRGSARLIKTKPFGAKSAMFRLWKKKERSVEPSKDRLDSWKEIAVYLRRDISTLHRWEKTEGLPVHRHHHNQLPTVYAYRSELDEWWNNRCASLNRQGKKTRFHISALKALGLIAGIIGIFVLGWWFRDSLFYGKRFPATSESMDWVLITDFKNTTGDPLLGESLEYAFQLELSSSGMVRVASRPRIEDTLRLMKRSLDSPVDLSLGKEICIRDGGMNIVIDGAIEKLDSRYRLSVRIVDPFSNVSDRAQAVIVKSEAEILKATHQLSNWLRQNLGESLDEIEVDSEPLQKVTTPSLKALRLFTHQDQLQKQGKPDAAIGLLRAAIGEDPKFAIAYAWLAWALKNSGRPIEESLDCSQKAVDLSRDVSEWERYYIWGTFHSLNNELELALPYWEGLCFRYPNELWGYNQLKLAYQITEQYEKLVELNQTVASLRPHDFISNYHAASTLSRISNDFASAEPYYAKARELADRDARERWPIPWAQVELYWGTGVWSEKNLPQILEDLEKANKKLDTLDEKARSALVAQMVQQYLGLGRISDAKTLAHRVSENDRAFILEKITLADGTAYKPEGQPAMDPIALARGGYVDKAETMLSMRRKAWLALADSLAAVSRSDMEVILNVIAGEIALARGESDTGIQLLRENLQRYQSLPYPREFLTYFLGSQALARELRHRGELVEAAQVLEKALIPEFSKYTEGIWVNLHNRWNLIQIYRQLGRIDQSKELLAELKALLRYADKDHPILESIREMKIHP
jgi:tetratricopeptide (TPR) repeat protein